MKSCFNEISIQDNGSVIFEDVEKNNLKETKLNAFVEKVNFNLFLRVMEMLKNLKTFFFFF